MSYKIGAAMAWLIAGANLDCYIFEDVTGLFNARWVFLAAAAASAISGIFFLSELTKRP